MSRTIKLKNDTYLDGRGVYFARTLFRENKVSTTINLYDSMNNYDKIGIFFNSNGSFGYTEFKPTDVSTVSLICDGKPGVSNYLILCVANINFNSDKTQINFYKNVCIGEYVGSTPRSQVKEVMVGTELESIELLVTDILQENRKGKVRKVRENEFINFFEKLLDTDSFFYGNNWNNS